ncbi:L,D-transpeptidase catalytic domain protein [Bacteriovorax sp. BSW11_IV]|uniref:murein L,D-transpeptidase catalytic domain-containing protein n=1 Tax=Bacteriovorax sp. BSW11_IV TaxID=1353529 RepID=UPI000389F49B|nr:murein L,D-transpeptidase catalytic domain family protein [Bacteriovorax sp. BSW11_IV]EQC50332.1 L,D-transpeptidase catalytic domain protein [Bacteriovorax sp. BSW11_IV]
MKIALLLLTFISYQSIAFNEYEITENFKKLGGDEDAIAQALCFYSRYEGKKFKRKIGGKIKGSTKITNDNYIAIVDLTKPSFLKRFFLVNLKSSEVKVYNAAHGSGNFNGTFNLPANAKYFSNTHGSNLTPRGFMISGERVVSRLGWKWHMKLDGVEQGVNDNSRDRAIVYHAGVASYDSNEIRVREGVASSNEDEPILRDKDGAQFMSNGCTMVAKAHSEEIYSLTKSGTLFYNFTPYEKEQGIYYCGGEKLLR